MKGDPKFRYPAGNYALEWGTVECDMNMEFAYRETAKGLLGKMVLAHLAHITGAGKHIRGVLFDGDTSQRELGRRDVWHAVWEYLDDETKANLIINDYYFKGAT